jgi:hypothetical protein
VADDLERLHGAWQNSKAAYDHLIVSYFGPGAHSHLEMPGVDAPDFSQQIEEALAAERAAWSQYRAYVEALGANPG